MSFNYYTLTSLHVVLVVLGRTHLSRDLIASQFYHLWLANTPSIWWNRAVTGPALFACSEARLRLLAKMKTKSCEKQKHMQQREFGHVLHCVPDWGGKKGRALDAAVDDALKSCVCRRRPRLWNDCCDPNWAPRMKGSCVYNRAQMMMKRTKAGSLLKA